MNIEELKQEYKKKVEEFGSEEYNKTERRKMLRQLRDMEQKLDKYFQIR